MSKAGGEKGDATDSDGRAAADSCLRALETGRDFAVGETAGLVDSVAERALCRKFDCRLLPVLALMYLFNALDKGNLANAETAGLSEDLKFGPGEYNVIVGIFFVPYVLFAPPIAMLGKKYGPARVLPVLMFCFGSLTLLTATAHTFGAIFAIRCFLGMAESAFFPLVIYYQTTFYRRGELARRLAIFYAASNVASAFSGLLASAVFQIRSNRIDFVWRWLFIIEGCTTVAFSLFAFLYLPKSADEATFLSQEEKALARHRIQVDSSSIVNEEFNLKESLKIFKRGITYGFLLIEICLGVPLQAVSLFLPQIVQRLVDDKVKTNLYTVAPNVTGAAMLLILAFSSDHVRVRSPFICAGFTFTFVGFILYAAIPDVQAQSRLAYLATFMMCWGTSAPSVLLSTWYNNNVAHEGERLTLTSVGVPLANLMGLVASAVFQKKDAPKYLPALITTAAFGSCGCAVAAALALYMIWDNRRRDAGQGVRLEACAVSTQKLRFGPAVPDFRWFL